MELASDAEFAACAVGAAMHDSVEIFVGVTSDDPVRVIIVA